MPKLRQTTHADLRAAIDSNGGVECEQVPHVFYPEDIPGLIEKRQAVELAKTICERCPILETCRNYALENGEGYGIWAGLLASER